MFEPTKSGAERTGIPDLGLFTAGGREGEAGRRADGEGGGGVNFENFRPKDTLIRHFRQKNRKLFDQKFPDSKILWRKVSKFRDFKNKIRKFLGQPLSSLRFYGQKFQNFEILRSNNCLF